MSLPDIAVTYGIDDLDQINDDISELTDRFIKPIDQIRSIAKPSTSTESKSQVDDFTDLKIDLSRVVESRTHAFYRMLGFPVVGGDSFYNSGYSPLAINKDKRDSINSNFYSNKELANLISQREDNLLNLRKMFIKQDLESIIFCLLMRFNGPFNVLKEDSSSFDIDKQTFTINERETFINKLADKNQSLSDKIKDIGNKYKTFQKLLRPFFIEPRVENTVTPDINKICVPFLKTKNDTQIYKNIYIKRPGIELIIRQRLENKFEDVNFLKNIENIISEVKESGVSTLLSERSSIYETLVALSDKNKISDDTRDIFTGFSSVQSSIVIGLIKTLKIIIKKLILNQSLLDKISTEINWTPVPSIDGPITGSLGASLARIGFNNNNSKLDLKITELRIKKLNAESEAKNIEDLGEFASPFSSNLNSENLSKFSEELDELIEKRDKIANDGFVALKEIENITGQISGLGLIDIISIYIALWSIDLKYLIALLDNDSFDRLYTIKLYQGNKDIDDRKNDNGVEIKDAYKAIENRIFNILSYADRLYEIQLLSPLESTGDV